MHKLIKNTPIFRADLGKKAFFGLSRRRREKNRHFVIRTRLNFKVLGIKFNFSPSWGGAIAPIAPPWLRPWALQKFCLNGLYHSIQIWRSLSNHTIKMPLCQRVCMSQIKCAHIQRSRWLSECAIVHPHRSSAVYVCVVAAKL